MATRLTASERDTIIRCSAAKYRHNATSIQENFNCWTDDPVASQVHSFFAGTYAHDIVWSRLVTEVGEERASHLSTENFNNLVAQAQAYHEQYVRRGTVTPRGLLIDRETGLARVQSRKFNEMIKDMKEVQAEYAWL